MLEDSLYLLHIYGLCVLAHPDQAVPNTQRRLGRQDVEEQAEEPGDERDLRHDVVPDRAGDWGYGVRG